MEDTLRVHFLLDTWDGEGCELHWTRMNVSSYDDALKTMTALRKASETVELFYVLKVFSVYRNGDFEAKFVWNSEAKMFEHEHMTN